MVLDRKTGEFEHRFFYELLEYLNPGDCLVINNTRVIPARLIGKREDTGGKMEFLLVKHIDGNNWEIMAKPGRKAMPGSKFVFGDGILKAQIIGFTSEGYRSAVLEYSGDFDEVLDKLGRIPLPPYIKKEVRDIERYQTVYSCANGSIAAPTAGLHFTESLIQSISAKGISIAALTLHVGPGTFRPVDAEVVSDHKMHSEFYIIDEAACSRINSAKKSGHRVIAVGTTSCRVLETVSDANGIVHPDSSWTDIFIYPGYIFKTVDALVTNFHLPESTLLMLVSAFTGYETVKKAYSAAIENGYRFFSFGDAMFLK